MFGQIVNVVEEPRGGVITAVAGQLVTVVTAADFDPEGGWFVDPDGARHQYMGIVWGGADDAPDQLVLAGAGPLTADAGLGEMRVLVDPPAVDVWASVETDTGAVPCLVTHALRPILRPGVRDGVRESVRIERRDQSWFVVDVLTQSASVSAETVAGDLTGVDIYSPDATSLPRVHVGGSVLEVIRSTDSEGAPAPAIRIGGADADQIMLYGADGNPLAGIDPAGNGIFCDVNVAGGLSLGGRNILEYMAENYAFGLLTANAATADTAHFGSGELGLWGLDCTLRGGRLYRIGFSGYASVATASAVQFFLRHTTRTANGNAAPTVSSLLMNSWISPASTTAGIRSVEGSHYIVGTGTDYRLLLSAKNATGNIDSFAYGRPASPFVFFVEDIGWADASVMSNGYTSTGGGTPYSGTTAAAPAVYTRIKTTSTWNVVPGTSGWARSWRAGAIVTDYLQQGYFSPAQRYSMLGAPASMFTALAGSTVNLVEVFLQNRSFYNNSGGTVLLSPHGATSAPATYTAPGAQTPVAVSWPYGAGKWVTLPAAWNQYFRTGQYQGVVLGEGASTASTYYGKFDLAGSKFRVTYTK